MKSGILVRYFMLRKCFMKKKVLILSSAGLLGFSQLAFASAFQLWEQDGASVGSYHAGRAAIAEDASTAFYNPAGLVLIKNQELIVGYDPVITNIKFNGTVNVNGTGPVATSSQGGGYNFIPSVQYAAPLSDRVVFALSAVYPFGLKTDYSQQDYTRYAATLTSLAVIDYTPSLGVKLTDKWSIGGGFDIERANGELSFANRGSPVDTYAQNTGADHAYGYHVGALYQFSPTTRVGLGYNSKVVHVLHGSTVFNGPLATNGFQSNSSRLKLVLPATTTLSAFHQFNAKWDGMASVIYTQWNVEQQLVITDQNPSFNMTIPQNYKNTWNFSVGGNYHVTEQFMLRAGLGFDQTPTNNQDRNLQIPDSNRIAVALGTHFQANSSIGLDVGWTHLFAMNTRINNTQVGPLQTVTTNGSVQGSSDVFGLQLKWDVA